VEVAVCEGVIVPVGEAEAVDVTALTVLVEVEVGVTVAVPEYVVVEVGVDVEAAVGVGVEVDTGLGFDVDVQGGGKYTKVLVALAKTVAVFVVNTVLVRYGVGVETNVPGVGGVVDTLVVAGS
jgi:hypothetical protein